MVSDDQCAIVVFGFGYGADAGDAAPERATSDYNGIDLNDRPNGAVGARRGCTMSIGRKTTSNGRADSAAAKSEPQGTVSLRAHAECTLTHYFESLNGHRPAGLYQLVIREVEEPLFRAVLKYTDGNQVRAAEVLGINRGTLRRKLEDYGLVD